MKPNVSESPKYPIGTIAAYGPDNKRATKLVVAVFKKPGRKEPDELQRWLTQVGDGRNDPVIAAEVADFLKRHGVRETVTGDRIMGCPHEEGIDYPLGGICPHCPFWANIDRFTHEPKQPSRPHGVGRNDPCPCGRGEELQEVLRRRGMSSLPKSVLADCRPRGFHGRGDKYLGELAKGLRRVLCKTQQAFTYPTCRLAESEWSEIAVLLVEWAEDIHNDLGLWRTVEGHQQQCFGTPLPLVISAAQKDELRGLDRRRIQYLLWNLWPCFNRELVLSPTHADLTRVAEAASQFLTERFVRVPQDSGVKRFLTTSNQYGWDVKRKLVWLGTASYLFRFLFCEYLADQDMEAGVATTDDFVCQHCTVWAGLGVIDVLAGALDLTEAERDTLRTWYERHTSFYRVLTWQEEAGEVKCIAARNVVNGQPYVIRMNMDVAACPFKPGLMVFGALTPWRGEWYWSGEQKTWPDMPQSEEPKLRREMLERSSAIAYRYCPAEAAKARQFTGEHHTKFIAHYGSDLVTFPDGLALAAAEQRRMETEWRAADAGKVAQTMRAHGLQHPRPRMTFPPEFLNHDQGIGAFFNPAEGVEYMLRFNHVLSALDKRGIGLNEGELQALQEIMASEAISPTFVRRLVADHGVESIAEAFMMRDVPYDLALDFLLRRHKGHFYRKRYPTLSLRRGDAPEAP